MAKVANPTSTNKAIFSKVFPKHAIPGAEKRGTTAHRTDATHLAEIRSYLQHRFEQALGIGFGRYVYGWDRSFDGEPFRIPISECPPMIEVRPSSPEEAEAHCATLSGFDLWQNLTNLRSSIGLQRLVRMVAEILHALITKYVRWAYSDTYRTDLADHLRFWVEDIYTLVVNMAQVAMTGNSQGQTSHQPSPTSSESRYVDTAFTALGALRVEEMYKVIALRGPSDAIIEDLKKFTTGTVTRTFLTDRFNEALTNNALHPGASTIEILRLYISTIRFFRKLDPKGVLLDRVAKRVRRYLREREDTVKVVVSGLLSDPADSSPDPEVLSELATELHQSSQSDKSIEDNDLDWHNMEWFPDPADAAPDYMKSRNTEVIGSLMTLFESKEVFVKEIQTVFAERLLENKTNFDIEAAILAHLKLRLGESSLQACEVMLRDVQESVKIDTAINKMAKVNLHAKILSRLFWPSMSEQAFEMTPTVAARQVFYEGGFAKQKSSRKLTWVQSLGQVDVELELEDRTVRESVLPYQATVIYAFQESHGDGSTPVTRSVSDLAEELSMLAALARSACILWLSKRVLVESAPDTFTVLERLSGGGDVTMSGAESKQDASAAAAEAAAAQAAREAEEEERKQKMAIYHQFVVSMLTNQGAMPLARIAMMLNIVVPGGFPFNNEELKDFLTAMVKEGQLEVGPGGNYKAIG